MRKEIVLIIKDVHQLLTVKGMKLAAAESCTGGLISHYLTALPRASRFFEAGVVTYSALSKVEILGVSSKTIAAHGVVSRETAKEMAEKFRLITGADYTLSTTGNLGPDVLEEKERGLVYIGISKEGKTAVRELHLQGERLQNREAAAHAAILFLREELSAGYKQ